MTDWDKRFLDFADHISMWSKDTTKVGTVVVDAQKRILSIGYNGIPSGCDDDIEERYIRPKAYFYQEHAERNAIYNAVRAGVSLTGSTIYLPWFPCADCARAIIQSGISTVVSRKKPDFSAPVWGEHFKVSLELLEEAKINIRYYKNSSVNYNIQVFDMTLYHYPNNCFRTEIVAISDNKIIGHLSLDVSDDWTSISWVYVDEIYRKNGIATALLDMAWETTKNRKTKQCGLVIENSSEQSRLVGFYEKRGFKFLNMTEENGNIMMLKTEDKI